MDLTILDTIFYKRPWHGISRCIKEKITPIVVQPVRNGHGGIVPILLLRRNFGYFKRKIIEHTVYVSRGKRGKRGKKSLKPPHSKLADNFGFPGSFLSTPLRNGRVTVVGGYEERRVKHPSFIKSLTRRAASHRRGSH